MYTVAAFITDLDRAVAGKDARTTVREIERVLTAAAQKLTLPAEFRRPAKGTYARRLLHHSKEHGYTVVVMVWGKDQGTPVHDHSHLWCVEGVMEGKIEVCRFQHEGETPAGLDRLTKIETILAGVGESGHLIPPFEHHTIKNALADKPSITIHVYEKHYAECSIFTPQSGDLYRRETKVMTFTEERETDATAG